ncbi:MAG: CAP domain-containing protein [Chloroflexota bacterium]
MLLSRPESDFLNDLNAYRAANHLATVKPLPVVQVCTTWMSEDMQKRWSAGSGLSHIDSMGRDFGPRVRACGYDQNAYKGEILAAGFTDGHAVFNAWKASSTHNPIMLGSQYRYVGVSMTNGLWDVDFVSLYDNTYAE